MAPSKSLWFEEKSTLAGPSIKIESPVNLSPLYKYTDNPAGILTLLAELVVPGESMWFAFKSSKL